jgi:uncharacterized protein YihD (DUF1040 family)
MKKYISTIFVLILIIPSIALASWWNPLTWFNSWNFKKEIVQKSETIEQTIINNGEINKENNPLEIKKVESKTENTNTNVISNSTINIDQNANDVCLNIDGVQVVIPFGKYMYKNTNQCLTNEEIEKYENKVSEENNERKNILNRLAEINGLSNYYSDLSTDKLKEMLKMEESKERNKILSGINKDLAERYYNSDLSNGELREVVRIEQIKNACLSKSSPYVTYKWDERNNACKDIVKDGYYIGCQGIIEKGIKPTDLKCSLGVSA